MEVAAGLFLDGLSLADRQRLEQSLEHRQFPKDSVILAEGDAPREMYIITSGSADVSMVGPSNVEHQISTLGPGDSVGEMSVLTGQPVSATVRALTDVEVLVLSDVDFDKVCSELPQLYRNLGSILSARLARTNRRAVLQRQDHAHLLINNGAPPLLGYALACSVAWHSRSSTAYVRLLDREPDPQLLAIDKRQPSSNGSWEEVPTPVDTTSKEQPKAHVILARQEDAFAPERIHRTLESMCDRFGHVLVEVDGPNATLDVRGKVINLAGPDHRSSSDPVIGASYALLGWGERTGRIGPGETGVIRIPEPNAEELNAIAGGLLSTTGAMGREIGWAARDLTNYKVGIALGAGAIKGYAHIGVLQAFERWGIPVDYIAGTSIGAGIASAYALGFPASGCQRILDMVGKSAFRITIPRHALLSNSRLQKELQQVAEDHRIEDLAIPLAVVAADVNSGREVVFRQGLVWPAVLASMAIPGIFPPVSIGSTTLVDGGVVNPVPRNAVADMGADTVIAVKLARRANEAPLDIEAADPSGDLPLITHTLTRSIDLMQGKIVTESAAAATVSIEPTFTNFSGWGLRMFGAGDPFVEVGEATAEAARPRLEAALPWLRP
jgi:NTE family protein